MEAPLVRAPAPGKKNCVRRCKEASSIALTSLSQMIFKTMPCFQTSFDLRSCTQFNFTSLLFHRQGKSYSSTLQSH